MPVGAVLLVVFVVVLVAGWLVLAYREPAPKRRASADYQHQHAENPDYFPGHGGGAQVGG